MKRLISSLVLLLALQFSTHAQGNLYLSNLAQGTSTTELIASDWWFGILFQTGANPDGYHLNSVGLLMSGASGTPNGFSVSLYSYNAGLPGVALGDLSGGDPLSPGTYTYSASESSLAPGEVYFIIATAGTPTTIGAYQWNRADTSIHTAADGWELAAAYYYSNNGSTWFLARSSPMQLSIYATPIPEPSSGLLLLIGTVLFLVRGRFEGTTL